MSGQYLSLVKPNQKTEDRASAAIVPKRQPPRAQTIMDRVESVEASIKYLAHSGTQAGATLNIDSQHGRREENEEKT